MSHKLKKSIEELTLYTIEEYKAKEKRSRIVVADNVRSMHNIGSLLRTADALGWEAMVMCGISAIPPHPEIHKTALGAENSVNWLYYSSSIEAVKQLKKEGWEICVLEQVHGSVPLPSFISDSKKSLALVVGNEVEGVSQEIVEIADHILEIPQEGTKHSMNVSVSAGMAMYQLSFFTCKD